MTFELDLEGDRVLQAYPDEILPVTPEASVGDVLNLLKSERTGCVVVCNQGQLAGIFTERDALRWMVTAENSERPIRELMSPDPVTLRDESSVAEAIQMMSSGGYRHLPIVNAQGEPTVR